MYETVFQAEGFDILLKTRENVPMAIACMLVLYICTNICGTENKYFI